jgi:amino acid transporter
MPGGSPNRWRRARVARRALRVSRTAQAPSSQQTGQRLGPLLCWAVVFADIGTSVYYAPGIIYQQVGRLAALFVSMTLIVFILLAIKYSEVAARYPEGGGVVTVATHALHPFAGLLGGLFILVDYFLTSALSAVSGLIYLSVVFHALKPLVVTGAVLALVLLAGLNVVGVRASAEVTAIFASAAAAGQLAVVAAVIVHVSPGHLIQTVPAMFLNAHLTPVLVLTGFAGSFLAFSGLESIAQLSPAMTTPRERTARIAVGLVVLTIAITSPLLTLWSTTLLDVSHADPNQFVSSLGGYAAGQGLSWYVAISGALLLVFASNTALIGSYHVFLALSRMRFLPRLVEQRNRWRGTPHWAIVIATAIPLAVVVIARGQVNVLGDLYAFGLLGAFSLTCLSLDIVRWRERWPTLRWLAGILTTGLVTLAWTTNLFAKPMATLFGGSLTTIGLAFGLITYWREHHHGGGVVFPYIHRSDRYPGTLAHPRLRPAAVLALLPPHQEAADAVTRAAITDARGRAIVFAFTGAPTPGHHVPELLEVVDPYLADLRAQAIFGRTDRIAGKERLHRRYVYLAGGDDDDRLRWLWDRLDPEEALVAEEDLKELASLPEGRQERVEGEPLTLVRYRPA